ISQARFDPPVFGFADGRVKVLRSLPPFIGCTQRTPLARCLRDDVPAPLYTAELFNDCSFAAPRNYA
ncbi:MAG: hypothetical protein R3C18_27340, partial [Planctomycetaceae bacterium]